jgi:hypothetical protein
MLPSFSVLSFLWAVTKEHSEFKCEPIYGFLNHLQGCCKARRILSFAPRSPSHLDSYFKGHKQYVSLLEEHSYGSYGNSSIVKEYCVIDHCKPESSAVKTLAQPPQGSGLLFYASDDGRSILRTPNTVRCVNFINTEQRSEVTLKTCWVFVFVISI